MESLTNFHGLRRLIKMSLVILWDCCILLRFTDSCWITLKFNADMFDAEKINPNDIADPLTFLLVPSASQNLLPFFLKDWHNDNTFSYLNYKVKWIGVMLLNPKRYKWLFPIQQRIPDLCFWTFCVPDHRLTNFRHHMVNHVFAWF